MSDDNSIWVHKGSVVHLTASRESDLAILELDLENHGRIAVAITQAALLSLYQHILTEADAGHLAFDLLSASGGR